MTAVPKHKMTADEFLVWSEAQPKEAGKFELWDGEIIIKHGPVGQQQAEKARHWEAKSVIAFALRDAIKARGLACFTAIDGASVRIAADKLVEPDVIVYCGERPQPSSLEAPSPIIVVEVLSPGTKSFDLSDKFQGYFTLPSVHHYLVYDPAKPMLIHHKRGQADAIETRFVRDERLLLDPPGLDVDLSELWQLGRPT